MRKFITSLKSVVSAVIIAAMAFSVSCSYDDTAINDRVDQVEKDLAALTERVAALESKLQSEVESLKALIDGKVVIVDVITGEDGTTVIKLSDGKTITVVNECKYVACDHECTPCDCDNLKYRVTDGVLEVSADGETWVAINGVAADQVVVDVVLNEDGTVTVKLANGEEFTVVKAELIECEAAKAGVYVLPGATKEVAFSVNDAVVDINVMNQPFGWSATVEEAVEAPEAPEAPEVGDDEGGVAPMPLAAGGKNYVLKINGPAATLKEAAKEGVVSVHFNTAAGACKVLTVNVILAELTLAVDGDGNITITNSIAYEQTDHFGEKFVDFADFNIGVMEADVYAEYGNDAFRDNFSGGYYDANINATKRSTGIFNILDEMMHYEEGVCDVETIQITATQLGGAFWPTYDFEYGKEYIIFVTLDSEVLGGYEIPVLDNAVMANYKKSLLKAEYVSSNWKGADFKFSLAGNTHYLIGWMSVEDVEMYKMYGVGSTAEEIIPQYIVGYGVMQAGAIVPVENIEIGETIALADLANRSFYEWAPELMTDTEYYLYIYPFDAPNGEMDFYSLSPAAEDIYIAENTFKTGSLGDGSFDAGAQFELVSWAMETVVYEEEDYSYEVEVLTVKATFASDVKDIIYAELNGPAVDSDEGISAVLNSYAKGTAKVDGDLTIKITYPSDPTYLGVIAVNAEGQGVYVEQKFEKPVPPATDVKALSAKAYYNSNNSYCTIVDFTLENEEVATVAFRTGNGGWDNDVCYNYGFNYINIGDWYDWSNRGESEVWYTNAYLDGSSAVVKGAIVVDYNADGYSFTFRINDYNVTYVGAVEGLVAPENYQAGEPEEPEESADFAVQLTKIASMNNNVIRFEGDNAEDNITISFNPGLETIAAGHYNAVDQDWVNLGGEFAWTSATALEVKNEFQGSSVDVNAAGGGAWYYSHNGVDVTVDGDVYTIVAHLQNYISGSQKTVDFTYVGKLEAPSSSGPDLTGYGEGTGAVVAYNSGSGTVRFTLTYLDSVVLQIYPFYGNESEVHFTVGADPVQVETLTLAGFSAQSGTVDLYQQADGRYLVMVDATFQTVGPYKFYFYVTL